MVAGSEFEEIGDGELFADKHYQTQEIEMEYGEKIVSAKVNID